MSKLYTTEYTLEILGDGEKDYPVRAHVEVDYDGGCHGYIDGDVEVLVKGAWLLVDALVDAATLSRVEDALCELALEDDSDVDYRPHPYYGREGARYAR